MKTKVIEYVLFLGLICLAIPVSAQTTVADQPVIADRPAVDNRSGTVGKPGAGPDINRRIKEREPALRKERVTRDLKIPEPTVIDKAEERSQEPLFATVRFRDNIDPHKYGFKNIESFKVAARKALGLPKDFPIYIRDEIDHGKRGKRLGVLFAGPSPQVIDNKGKPLSLEQMRKLSRNDDGSVLGKRPQ